MKDGELAVPCRMHVDLDDIGAGGKAGLHRPDGVFEIVVFRRQHAGRRAGVVLQIGFVEPLGDAAMGKQHRLSRPMFCKQAGIVEIDAGGSDGNHGGTIEKLPAQDLSPSGCIE
ncbi:hypothetical protein ACVITL_001066 [Rhizobium pisi]